MWHKLTIDGAEREHYFAYVRWFKKHPQTPCAASLFGMETTLNQDHVILFYQFIESTVSSLVDLFI